MKKILLTLLITLMSSCSAVLAATPLEPLNPNIFQWVQTTPRAQYYFNKQVITFQTNAKGEIDTNVLIVPTVKILDSTEVEDITLKRQWREENTYRFGELAATAEYLKINLATHEVTFLENNYLDRGYNPLQASYQRPNIDLNTLGTANVNYIFYKAIIDYAKENERSILKSMLAQGYTLTPEELDKYNLLPNGEDKPLNKKDKRKSKSSKTKVQVKK